MKVKVCGMREAANIRAVDDLFPDLMGFIFYEKSPRHVSDVPEFLPRHAERVGVFVDAESEHILSHAREFGLQYVQLHGSESPELCRMLRSRGLKVIKAFSISSPCDVMRASEFLDCCDMFVFDTKCKSMGGSGRTFDWKFLDAYIGNVPFLLSGGIGPDTDLGVFSHPMLAGYDLNSRFEISPGLKDVTALETFINKIRSL